MYEKTFYWNRKPGKFVNKLTGKSLDISVNGKQISGPLYNGTVQEWYETLVETLIDLRNQLGGDSDSKSIKVFVDSDVRMILESTVLFKPNIENHQSKTVGTLCGMNIIVSRSVPRFELRMELKNSKTTAFGRVIVTED